MLRLFYCWSMLLATIRSRIDSERGATAVEYGLMVAAIAAVIVAIVVTLGAAINQAFTDVCAALPGCTP